MKKDFFLLCLILNIEEFYFVVLNPYLVKTQII